MADEHPTRIAISTLEQTITYGQLASAARNVAQSVRALDVRPNELVAIVMSTCWEQVVAAFGILEAGGAYMPVGADFPRNRIDTLLTVGEVRVVTRSSVAADYTPRSDLIELTIDEGVFQRPPAVAE